MKLLAILALVCLASASYLDAPAMSKDIIVEINSRQDVHWKAGVNSKFDGKTLRQVADLCGALPSSHEDETPVDDVRDDIPTEFDAREHWPHCPSIREIRDQSVCGSCWAFGASEAWSDRVCIGSNAAITQDMSSEDLLTCCGYSCGMGCNGGQLPGAWKYIKGTGLVSGGLYSDKSTCSPYSLAPCDHHVNGTLPPCGDTVPTPKCVKSCQAGYDKSWNDDKHKASKVYPISSKVAAIQTEIMTNGPIEAAFSVYADFPTYKSGVYHHVTGSFLGGHAIKIIGWGVENGVDYWLVANSWNTEWGNQGLFRIKRGTNECGIEADGYAGVL